ncbi:unnamed protein product [Symbiodinium sp. CCMP2592]|nr:unnamed protein product [Symbiodinium sp. CCMP2592]
MLATAALTRRAVQTRSCKAAALTVRTCIVLSCFALLYAAHAAHMAASRYEQKVSATLQQILEAQARAAADTAESEWHRAKAAEDAAAEARDEAEADTDAAAAESDRAEEVEDNAKAATDETNADKEEAEAETESKKVAADETAADSEQAGATAEGAKASEEEAEAEADEAAEVVLSVVPGVDVVADTAGTAVAGGLQATAAADTAEAAELEGESMSEWAAKLEAEAELGQTRAAEAAVGNRAIRNRAAAKEAEEEAEAEEADEESERAHKAKTEEDAAKQKAKAAQEKADAEQARAHAVCKFVDLIDFSIEAILFALLSLAFAVLPALFLLGKWVASACRFGGWLVLRPCQTLAAGGSRQFVECLHGLTLALMAFRFLLPVVAAAVRKLGHDELRLGNFKDTHKSAAIMLHNFEILAPTIKQGSADMACMAGLVSAAGSACCRWQWAPPPQEMLEQQETGQPQRESRGIWVCLADAALTLLEGTISVVEGAMTIGAGWMLSSLLMFALCVCELAVPYALPRAKTFVAHWWFWLMYSIVVLVLADVAYVVIHLRPWCRRGDLKGVQEALLPQ